MAHWTLAFQPPQVSLSMQQLSLHVESMRERVSHQVWAQVLVLVLEWELLRLPSGQAEVHRP
jgi:hypothetical protein